MKADPRRSIEAFLLTSNFHYVVGWDHRVPPGNTHAHDHPDYEIVYHVEGTGVTRSPVHAPIPFFPGSVTIHAPLVLHAPLLETAVHDICLRIAGPKPPACLPPTMHIPMPPGRYAKEELQALSAFHMPPGGYEKTEQLASSALLDRSSPASRRILDLRATALMITLLAEALTHSRKPAQQSASLHAERGHRLLIEGLQAIGNVEDVARELGLSPDYFRHVFTEKYGMGPRQFLVQTRLQRAAELLAHSGLPTKEIASQCGFTTDRYFCTSFRRFTGTTPASFRKRRTATPAR